MKQKSTAIYWKSESCDDYLHSYPRYISKNEAKKLMAEIYGEEFTEYCCDFNIAWG